MMKRREFLKSTGIGALAVGMSPGWSFGRDKESGTGKPNIILIMVDDLGAEGIGCYGGKTNKTPEIDALAADGLRFENAFSQPICGPTRACILSGRYPFRSGVATNHGPSGFGVPWGRGGHGGDPNKPEITFANIMKEQGYATGITGKWALCHFDKTPDHVTVCGFDHYYMWPKCYGKSFKPKYWGPVYYENEKLISREDDVFGPDLECDYLIDFINKNKDRPFLAYWPMTLIHGPLVIPPGADKGGGVKHSRERRARFNMLHKLNVEYTDRLVGKLTEAVDKAGLAEKTLIIFTCDNGTHAHGVSQLGDREIQGGKGKVFDVGTRVPFIARWTGTLKPGGVTEDLIDFSDILPTFAELAGAEVPTDRVIDGRSFAPQLRGKEGNPRQWVYTQNDDSKLVRGKKWSLDESGKLYDMTDRYDPKEVEAGQGGAEAEAARKGLQAVMSNIKG